MPSRERLLPQTWLIGTLTLVMVLCLAFTADRVLNVEAELRRTSASENAARYSEALMAFRTVYTSEVVKRANALGIDATHDYLKELDSIPLPATLTKVLAEHLGANGNTKVRLYSDQPFPWRRGGLPLDEGQLRTLSDLRKRPTNPVVRFEHRENVELVTYAVADTLRPECVDCHNTHPDSPRRDWEVGDVRGVLEVSHAVGIAETELNENLKDTVQLLFWISILGLLSLALSALYLRRAANKSQRLALEADDARIQIQREMSARLEADGARLVAEAQVRHAQKLESLGVLSGGIAHDFNNLLVSILGNTQLIQERLDDDNENQRRLELVEQAGLRAAALTKKLLAYAGGTPLDPHPVNLNDSIRQMIPIIATAIDRNTSFVLELDEHISAILADSTHLEQCILNLVTNAADAIGSNQGTITVRTGMEDSNTQPGEVGKNESDRRGRIVYLTVEDNGSGISKDDQERMFDPFYSTKGTGRGLGLATLLGIVTAHNGEILVASEEEKGTTIRIAFPEIATKVRKRKTSPTKSQPLTGDGRHVLLIDDEDSARETTSTLLNSRGFVVTTASSGQTGLELANKNPDELDVVLLDMTMPGLNGLDTYLLLIEKFPNLPVVFYSGFAALPELKELIKTDKVKFVRKPFTTNEIVGALLQACNPAD